MKHGNSSNGIRGIVIKDLESILVDAFGERLDIKETEKILFTEEGKLSQAMKKLNSFFGERLMNEYDTGFIDEIIESLAKGTYKTSPKASFEHRLIRMVQDGRLSQHEVDYYMSMMNSYFPMINNASYFPKGYEMQYGTGQEPNKIVESKLEGQENNGKPKDGNEK